MPSKLTSKTAATVVNDADLVGIVQGGISKKATAALVRQGLQPGSDALTALAGYDNADTLGLATTATYSVYWNESIQAYNPRPDVSVIPAGQCAFDSFGYKDARPPLAEEMEHGDWWVPDPWANSTSYDILFDGEKYVIKPGPPTGVGPPPDPFPVAGAGGVTYSANLLADWEADGETTEWTRLAGTSLGNVGRSVITVPSFIQTVGDISPTLTSQQWLAQLVNDAVHIRVQAILSVGDENGTRQTQRINKVTDYLDMFASTQPVFEVNTTTQTQRLNAGWMLSNILRAAAIVQYDDVNFIDWLVNYCWNVSNTAQSGPTLLDWPTNGNWHALFVENCLGIAVISGQEALWDRARLKYRERIAQNIYHSDYDGASIYPLKNDQGVVSNTNTYNHWGGGTSPPAPQVSSPNFLANFPNGTNCERLRNHGYVCMSLTSLINGANTIRAQGETLFPDEYDRIKECANYHASRVLPWCEDQTIVEPWPTGSSGTYPENGLGGSNWSTGWFAMKAFLGVDASLDLENICLQDEIISYSPAGTNHLGSDLYAFGA